MIHPYVVIMAPVIFLALLLVQILFNSARLQRTVGILAFRTFTTAISMFDKFVFLPYKLDAPFFWFADSFVPPSLKFALVCASVRVGSAVYRAFPHIGGNKLLSPEMRFLELSMRLKDSFTPTLARARWAMKGIDSLAGTADTPMTRIPDAGTQGSYWLQCLPRDATSNPSLAAGPTAEDTSKVMLWFFGGAFIAGGPEGYRGLMTDIGTRAGMNALLVNYRVPSVEEALEDAVSAYRWLLDRGVAPSRIVVGGVSSGGGLSLLLLQKGLRPLGLPLPGGVLALSPFLDLADETDHLSQASTDPFVSVPVVKFVLQFDKKILPRGDPRDWSPALTCDATGFPPLYLTTSASEVCAKEIEAFEQRALQAGVPTTVYKVQNLFHAYILTYKVTPEGAKAMDAAVAWLRDLPIE